MVRRSELEQLIFDLHTHNINQYSRELYLHSAYNPGSCDCDGEPGVEYMMATNFVKNLHFLERRANANTNILIHMHTVGGEWNDGMAIYNAIQFSPCYITVLAYAQASSMSGVILQAADRRIIMPDCEFMIHHGSVDVSSTSMAAKSAIDMNERYCKRMLEIFAAKAKNGKFFKDRGYSESRVKSYIDRKIKDKSDWFLSAEEAVYYGFCDALFGEGDYKTLDSLLKN